MTRKTYLFSLLVVLSAGMCAGQQPVQKDGQPYYHGDLPAQPAPLKCGKYEHVEGSGYDPNVVYCSNGLDKSTCKRNPAYICAPDLHTVTEKERQELMGRLKRLEAR